MKLAFLTPCLFVLALVVGILNRAEPGLDEAMLMLNVPAAHGTALFAPLALYDQAAPIGYLAVAHAVTAAVPADPTLVLRGIGAVFALLEIAALYATLAVLGLRRLAPAVLVFACLTPYTLRYCLEIKQYQAEATAMAVMLLAGACLARKPCTRTGLLFVLAAAGATVFSFTAPVAIAAVCIAVTLTLLPAWRTGRASLVTAMAACLAASLATVLYYALVTRPLVGPQFAVSELTYSEGFLTLTPGTLADVTAWLRLPRFLVEMLSPTLSGRWGAPGLAAAAALLLFGVVSLLRHSRFLALTGAALLGLLYALNLVHVVPHAASRHVLFLVPLFAIAAAAGLDWVLVRTLPGRPAALAAVSIGLALLTMGQSAFQHPTALRPLIATYRQHGPAEPLWAYIGAQPGLDVVAPDLRPLGSQRRDSMIGLSRDQVRASMEQSWDLDTLRNGENRVSAQYLATFRADLGAGPVLWLLFTAISEANRTAFLTVAREDGHTCSVQAHDVGAELYRCVR